MIVEIIVLLLAIPVGLLVAYNSRDELIDGRKWFTYIFILSLLAGIWFYLIRQDFIMYSSFFISIMTLVSYIKSFDKKWTKK
jgi:hypothetical protein